MDYRKPWSFRLGIVVFATVAFLAATGHSVGWGSAEAVTTPSTAPSPVALLADLRP